MFRSEAVVNAIVAGNARKLVERLPPKSPARMSVKVPLSANLSPAESARFWHTTIGNEKRNHNKPVIAVESFFVAPVPFTSFPFPLFY